MGKRICYMCGKSDGTMSAHVIKGAGAFDFHEECYRKYADQHPDSVYNSTLVSQAERRRLMANEGVKKYGSEKKNEISSDKDFEDAYSWLNRRDFKSREDAIDSCAMELGVSRNVAQRAYDAMSKKNATVDIGEKCQECDAPAKYRPALGKYLCDECAKRMK